MRRYHLHHAITPYLVALTLIAATSLSSAQTETVLYNFGSSSDIGGPQAGIVIDKSGNIFGSAPNGFYELSPAGGGTYNITTLYTVASLSLAEGTPVLDSQGNVYGVITGGVQNDGMVVKLSPGSGGTWTEKTLYAFPSNGKRGNSPYSSPIFDKNGNIFGPTFYGGPHESANQYTAGTVYELVPQSNGTYAAKTPHGFGAGQDGVEPYANLIMDSAGNFYGTTTRGGVYGSGTVFELSPKAGGGWNERILHNFGNGTDGAVPYTPLLLDSAGNLYGTTTGGGTYSGGIAFELVRQSGGGWKEQTLHNFGNTGDGSGCYSGLVMDSVGNLYGATFFGGLNGGGTAYELTSQSDDSWSETILHNFSGGTTDGAGALGNLFMDASGNLYGTTEGSGTNDSGIVWEITP